MNLDNRLDELIGSLDKQYINRKGLQYSSKVIDEWRDSVCYEISIPVKNQKQKISCFEKKFNCKIKDADKAKFKIILEDKDYSTYFDRKNSYDSCDEIWNLHKKTNPDLSFEKGEHIINMRNLKLKVSGDVVFNFNNKKTKYFTEIIEDDHECLQEKREILKEMLKICGEFHNSPQNVSMVLSTGGLNNFKQSISNDRFDVYISEMKKYYIKSKLHILENGSSSKMSFGNRKRLETELDSFGNGTEGFNNYILYFYHLRKNSSVLNDLLKSGDTLINNCEGLFKYLCLAFEYWMSTADYYCSLSDEIRECFLQIKQAYRSDKIFLTYKSFADRWKSL